MGVVAAWCKGHGGLYGVFESDADDWENYCSRACEMIDTECERQDSE